ncbi:MAG: DUF4172 domain-containing protein [Syntrophaceae bacterium]
MAQGKLLGKVIDLGLAFDAHAQAEETMKTSAIEGERLDIRSVRSSMARASIGRSPRGQEWRRCRGRDPGCYHESR